MRNNKTLVSLAGKYVCIGSIIVGAMFTGVACTAKSDAESATEKKVASVEKAAPSAASSDLDGIKKVINDSWSAAKPGLAITDIEETEVAGIYKISAGHGQALYSTSDGKHFFTGDLYRVSPGKIVNVSEQAKNGLRAKTVAAIDPKEMISFSPKGERKKQLYVFTDVDCYYCQKLHANMAKMNELGIEVHYLAYPRAGINSESYNRIASAWCAKDKHEAMTKLKAKQSVTPNVCEGNPVAKQYQLGQTLGLSGTPALITEDGELIAGFMEPAALAQRLGI